MKLDSILLSFMGRQVLILWPESGHLGLTEDEDFHLHHENELKCEMPSRPASTGRLMRRAVLHSGIGMRPFLVVNRERR